MDEILCCVCERFYLRKEYAFSEGLLDYLTYKVCDYCTEEYTKDPRGIRPFPNWIKDKIERKKR